MFPKKGKTFPEQDCNDLPGRPYAAVIADALRAELGDTHRSVKIIMRWTGANERTVKNWLVGASGPSGVHLVALVRHSDLVLEAFLRLAGRERTRAEQVLLSVCERLKEALASVDTLRDRSP